MKLRSRHNWRISSMCFFLVLFLQCFHSAVSLLLYPSLMEPPLSNQFEKRCSLKLVFIVWTISHTYLYTRTMFVNAYSARRSFVYASWTLHLFKFIRITYIFINKFDSKLDSWWPYQIRGEGVGEEVILLQRINWNEWNEGSKERGSRLRTNQCFAHTLTHSNNNIRSFALTFSTLSPIGTELNK